MEALKSSMAAKVAAMMLFIICVVSFAASAAGMIAMDVVGGYQMTKEEMVQKAFDQACSNYSVLAMAGHEEDFNKEELDATNFRYGVVKADNIEDVDFSDPDSYIGGNFDEIPHVKQLRLEEFDISKNSSFQLGNGNILDSYYQRAESPFYYTEENYPLDGIFYGMDSDTFYARSGKKLFPMPENVQIYTAEDPYPSYLNENEAGELMQKDETGYSFQEGITAIFNDTQETALSSVRIEKDSELFNRYQLVSNEGIGAFDNGTFYTNREREVKFQHYIVASYVKTPLSGADSFRSGDMFVQAERAVDFAYRLRYAAILVLVLSVVLLGSSFVFLMSSAGHRRGQEGVHAGISDRIPLDLHAALTATAIWMLGCIVVILGYASFDRIDTGSLAGLVSFVVASSCAGIAAILFVMEFLMSFAVRVKLGKWWRHTIIYWIWRKCLHLAGQTLRFCVFVIAGLLKSMTLLWKAWFLLGFLAFVEFFMIASSYRYDYAVFWALEKAVLYPFIIIQLMQLRKLQKGAQRIADGALDYQIDTRHMFWEIKKHGEYLNDIGNGINSAVNERMKSEHFKTELITNVSHDIKTPLTSIINYVDLLRKEEIDNPNVKEYLEVLHRQSARLKKLIEDLMEASKASTGNLSVVMEKCDAGVMLVQTVGEFEEKLMANQIELQVKKPENGIYIQADNRHLWRVFDNLMNNICKYAQPMTRAYVNLEQDGQKAVITFRNISRYQLNISSEELMERFVRGDSSRNTEGSGLGISIAKSLTELMNGRFELIVDGDLFKAVLSFPLYGTEQALAPAGPQRLEMHLEDMGKKETALPQRLAIGIQNAGAQAAGIGQNVADKTGQIFRQAGAQAAGLGQNVADKTGRMVRRAGRFAYHVKQAAQQVKEEEAEWERQNAAAPEAAKPVYYDGGSRAEETRYASGRNHAEETMYTSSGNHAEEVLYASGGNQAGEASYASGRNHAEDVLYASGRNESENTSYETESSPAAEPVYSYPDEWKKNARM